MVALLLCTHADREGLRVAAVGRIGGLLCHPHTVNSHGEDASFACAAHSCKLGMRVQWSQQGDFHNKLHQHGQNEHVDLATLSVVFK